MESLQKHLVRCFNIKTGNIRDVSKVLANRTDGIAYLSMFKQVDDFSTVMVFGPGTNSY